MSRVIKFRAWGIDRGRMHDVYNIAFHESYGYKAITSEQPLDLHSTFTKKEEFILMQYTGLKDKNGVEIYEGDIVEITHPFRQRHHVGEVIYDGYQFNVKGFLFPHYDVPNDAFSEGCRYTAVIGNIYENPELLEVEV